jgi:myb proto-oncogene protein
MNEFYHYALLTILCHACFCRRSKKQNEDNVAVPDGLNNLSSSCNRSRKRKSTTGSNAAVQKRTRGSVPVGNEAVPIESRATVSADNEVETNIIMDPLSVCEEGVVKKRTRGSKPAGNNAASHKRIRGSIPEGNKVVPIEDSANDEVGTNGMMDDPASVSEEGVVKKRTRRSKLAGGEGAARKRKCTISADNEAGMNTRDPVSGEEEVVKKRKRCSKPVSNEGAARKKLRAPVSVGDEGVVEKRTGSVATENYGNATKRKRAPSR